LGDYLQLKPHKINQFRDKVRFSKTTKAPDAQSSQDGFGRVID
jgi:hypothetical protein